MKSCIIMPLVVMGFCLNGCNISWQIQPFRGPKAINIVYSGDVIGEVDPCGCSSGQKGGISRRSYFIKELRKKNPATVAFDTGNAFTSSYKLDPFLASLFTIKARFIVNAMNHMGYMGYVPGDKDIAVSLDNLSNIFSKADFHILWTNKTNDKDFPVKSLVIGDVFGIGLKTGVFGLSLNRNPDKGLIKVFKGSFKRSMVTFKKSGVGLIILLYSGPYRFLDELSLNNVPINIVILMSYEGQWWPKPRMFAKKRVLMVSIPKEGQYMGSLSIVVDNPSKSFEEKLVWMQAYFRMRFFESMLNKKKIKNRDLVESRYKEIKTNEEELSHMNLYEWKIIPLDDKIPEDPQMQNSVEKLKADIQQKYHNILKDRQKVPNKGEASSHSSILGEKACKNCHYQEWNAWRNTAHAKAFKTLSDLKVDQDPNCVLCHSTGLSKDLRLVELIEHTALPDVQCDSCHGGNNEHLNNPSLFSMKRGAQKTVCEKCHTRSQSPNFNFERYIDMIRCN